METNLNQHTKPWLWQTLGILLGLFLALLVLDKAHAVWENFRPLVPKNTIVMTAEGKVSATPDLAIVSVGVTSNGSTAKQVTDDMSKKVNQITDFVKQQGIDAKDIATTNFYVNQNYDYTNGTNKPTGYQGSENIVIKIRGVDKSTDRVGKILEGTTINGSNQIQGISFSFDDPDNLKAEARKLAIEKAKQKAQELADETGLKLGRIISVSDSNISYPMPMPYALSMGGSSDTKSVTPNIETGSQDITASVSVTFEVK